MEYIWRCILPMKKGQWDNEYYFYDNGSIKHFYDLSVKKYNIERMVSPTKIPEQDKQAILDKIDECPAQWQEFVLGLLRG